MARRGEHLSTGTEIRGPRGAIRALSFCPYLDNSFLKPKINAQTSNWIGVSHSVVSRPHVRGGPKSPGSPPRPTESDTPGCGPGISILHQCSEESTQVQESLTCVTRGDLPNSSASTVGAGAAVSQVTDVRYFPGTAHPALLEDVWNCHLFSRLTGLGEFYVSARAFSRRGRAQGSRSFKII